MLESKTPQAKTLQASVKTRNKCPRCSGFIHWSYEEASCLQCGYVDYFSPPQRTTPKSNSILNKGTEYILRYKGDSECLAEILTIVKVVRIKNRVTFDLDCPFCGVRMEQASMSGHRKEIKEERFKCPTGHRVSLIPSDEGVVGWK